MDTCLVTGGAGFIGSNLVRALLERGYRVRILDNFSTGRHANLEGIKDRIELVEGDLRSADAVRLAVTGARFIFHLGALPSVIRSVEDPASTHDVNITGTLTLMLHARDAGVERFMFTSSSSVYGDTPTLPKQEDMTPMPLSPYALSKLTGEHYARMFHTLYGMKTYSLRYFNVFGPRQDPKSHYAAVIPLFIRALAQDKAPTIFGDGEQTRDFTYVEDVVAGNLCCMTAPDEASGGVYNLAWGYRTSINELVNQIGALLGKSTIKPVYAPARDGDVRDSQADSTRARTLLKWNPSVPFDEGLQRTIAWFMDHPED
jgi:nucleoside-diphosphate-sugar epimerase